MNTRECENTTGGAPTKDVASFSSDLYIEEPEPGVVELAERPEEGRWALIEELANKE